MDEFRAKVHEYGERFHCRLDNAKLPEVEWIDYASLEARRAREDAST